MLKKSLLLALGGASLLYFSQGSLALAQDNEPQEITTNSTASLSDWVNTQNPTSEEDIEAALEEIGCSRETYEYLTDSTERSRDRFINVQELPEPGSLSEYGCIDDILNVRLQSLISVPNISSLIDSALQGVCRAARSEIGIPDLDLDLRLPGSNVDTFSPSVSSQGIKKPILDPDDTGSFFGFDDNIFDDLFGDGKS